MRSFSWKSLYLLNITQFFGALNDNIFKLLIVYFLIDIEGSENATSILAKAGAFFVIPFLLFSSMAGNLADKRSKRNIIVSMKIAEVVIMGLSFVGLALKSSLALYSLLFLMATQSAVFGPSKYGIIPEIVTPDKISKANGILTSFTFLAIIFGTFLASYVTDISNRNFYLSFLSCIIIALFGLFTSWGIKKTDAKKATRKSAPFFLYEVFKTLVLASKRKHLLTATIGSAFFLFIGAFAQLNTIPFAMQSLKLSDVEGGYLFLTIAIGIAIGSFAAGRLLKDQFQLGISCIAGFCMAILFFFLYFLASHLIAVCICFILLGVFGGLFLVPFDSFIQVRSPESRRGQMIAASNFLSFCGVLLASFVLYLIGNILMLSSATGFALMGILTLIFTVILSGQLSDVFLPYLIEKFVLPFYSIKISNIPPPQSLLVLNNEKWPMLFMLFGCIPNLKVVAFKKKLFLSYWINKLLFSITLIKRTRRGGVKSLLQRAYDLAEHDAHICLYFPKLNDPSWVENRFNSFRQGRFDKMVFIHIEKHKIPMSFLGINYQKRLLSITFSPFPHQEERMNALPRIDN